MSEPLAKRFADIQQRLAVARESMPPAQDSGRRHPSVEELELAMEELQVTQEELRVQNDQLLETQQQLELESVRYRELFDLAPDGYLVTDAVGKINDANQAATRLFNVPPRFLLGKPLATFVAHGAVRDFRTRLVSLARCERMEWPVHLRPLNRPELEAELTAVPVRDARGELIAIRWIVRDCTERREAERQILDYQRRLRATASELALSEERERRRIAEGLHDDITQTLAVSRMKLGALRASIAACNGAPQMAKLGALASEADAMIQSAITATRSLTFELSPPILYELGLGPALAWLADRAAQRHGMEVAYQSGRHLPDVPLESGVLLFQSVRELLVNVAKHASATRAVVTLRQRQGELQLSVEDNGVGFEPGRAQEATVTGYGLFSIRTRMAHLGGSVKVQSEPQGGTRVTLVLPLNATASKKRPRTAERNEERNENSTG